MPERVFYMRGFGPEPFPYPSTSTPFAEDLLELSILTDEQLSGIVSRLDSLCGFLNPGDLESVLEGLGLSTKSLEAIQRVLNSVNDENLPRLLSILSEDQSDSKSPISPSEYKRILESLGKLIKPYPSILRYRKAIALSELTGLQLESVDLVCDMRPIFNEKRESIEGFIPYTKIRLTATGADGLPKAFEAELSWSLLKQLECKSAQANKKLRVIQGFVSKCISDGIPALPTTLEPKDSENVES